VAPQLWQRSPLQSLNETCCTSASYLRVGYSVDLRICSVVLIRFVVVPNGGSVFEGYLPQLERWSHIKWSDSILLSMQRRTRRVDDKSTQQFGRSPQTVQLCVHRCTDCDCLRHARGAITVAVKVTTTNVFGTVYDYVESVSDMTFPKHRRPACLCHHLLSFSDAAHSRAGAIARLSPCITSCACLISFCRDP